MISALAYWGTVSQFSLSVVSNSLQSHGMPHARLPCPLPTAKTCSNSHPLSRWCHPSIHLILCRPLLLLPSVSCSIRMFPNESVLCIRWPKYSVSASASVLPMNIQDWSPLGLTGLISLQSKGPSRVFSNTKVQKHQFFSTQLSSQSNSHIHMRPLEKP